MAARTLADRTALVQADCDTLTSNSDMAAKRSVFQMGCAQRISMSAKATLHQTVAGQIPLRIVRFRYFFGSADAAFGCAEWTHELGAIEVARHAVWLSGICTGFRTADPYGDGSALGARL